MGAHGRIRLQSCRSHDLARTMGADDRCTSCETIGPIGTEGDSQGRRKAASGNEGQKEGRFRHGISNQLISEGLTVPQAKQ